MGSTVAFGRLGARGWVALVAIAVFPNAVAVAIEATRSSGLPGTVAEAERAPLATLGTLAFRLATGIAEEPGWRGCALERFRR